MLGAFKLPVRLAEPLIRTVPINVWVSFVASPNWLLPVDSIMDAVSYTTLKYCMDAVPFSVKLPLNVRFWFNVFRYDAVLLKDELTALSTYEAVAAVLAKLELSAESDLDADVARDALTAFKTYDAVCAVSAYDAVETTPVT